MPNRSPRFTPVILPASLACLFLLSSSCVHRLPSKDIPPGIEPGYVDLKAGWRLRVVVPILRSGGYIVPMTVEREEGRTISVRAGADFVGYETEYYDVKPRHGSGTTISFRDAEAVEEGKSSRRQRPLLQLFDLPPKIKFVRLIYLIRESKSDHNMVIVGATGKNTLAKLTVGVSSNESAMCNSSEKVACIFVPAGIAVVPEERIRIDGKTDWRPAR